jgi:DNA-directed RNA polymerase sigma subunit (sigma70/sigma32)
MSKKLDKAQRLARRHTESRHARDKAIRAAAAKHTLREVAAATGLSHQRVHQIVQDKQ